MVVILIFPQVLIAFVASAYVTLLLVFIYYALGCVDQIFLNSIDQSYLHSNPYSISHITSRPSDQPQL